MARQEKLPKRCQCGGRMVYTHDFGRVFSYCASCTPVVKIDCRALAAALKRSNG